MSESGKSTKSNSIFTPYQVERLGFINRLILRVTDKDIAADAAKLGYDDAEHEEGTKYYGIAAGHHVRFSHHLSSVIIDQVTSGGAETRAKIKVVDRFENKWHPRIRNAIRRFVVADQRVAFEGAFFRDMPMQPEGPLAVDSVSKLMPRLEDMKTSSIPGAMAAYAALEKKGLTADEIERINKLLTELGKRPSTTPAGTAVSEEEIQKIAAERLAAYERVNLWYTDWARVFRDELGYNQLLRLGLVQVEREAPETPETPEEPPVVTDKPTM